MFKKRCGIHDNAVNPTPGARSNYFDNSYRQTIVPRTSHDQNNLAKKNVGVLRRRAEIWKQFFVSPTCCFLGAKISVIFCWLERLFCRVEKHHFFRRFDNLLSLSPSTCRLYELIS